MVEVLIPNSIVNRSLHYNTTSNVLGSPLGSSYAGLGSNNDRYTLSSYDAELRCGTNGSNNDTPPSSLCDNTVREKVLRQVEWYFSDENLLKDAFLMKHITRNKHGYVSLKLVASLRKIKAITKDCKVVSECIKHSESLELNDDGTKVRRINPVPDVDYSGIPKTIIITNYSGIASAEDQADAIQREYSRYGNISRVLVLAPGKAIPLAIKSCKARFPCIGRELCILVEYESQEMATKALKESQRNWRQTATVQLLSSQQDHTEDALDQTPSTITDKKQRNTGNSSTPAVKKQDATTSKSICSRTRKNASPVNNSNGSTAGYGSDSGYSGASRSPSLSPKSSPAPVSRNVTPLRLETTLKIKPISASPLVSVIRKPKGPDGTRGFKR